MTTQPDLNPQPAYFRGKNQNSAAEKRSPDKKLLVEDFGQHLHNQKPRKSGFSRFRGFSTLISE
jgi:hypothetical protein